MGPWRVARAKEEQRRKRAQEKERRQQEQRQQRQQEALRWNQSQQPSMPADPPLSPPALEEECEGWPEDPEDTYVAFLGRRCRSM